jgi:hypothetical protein
MGMTPTGGEMSRKRLAALVLPAILLAACQSDTSQTGFTATPVDGEWVGTQGGVVATFQGGNFTSRLAETNEIVAQGTYTMTSGTEIRMEWQSPGTGQELSATCILAGASALHCKQPQGGDLILQRAA